MDNRRRSQMRLFLGSFSCLVVISLYLITARTVNGGNIQSSYILGDAAVNCGCLNNSTALDGRLWVGETPLLQPQGESRISAPNLLAADPIPYKTARVSFTSFYYSFRVSPGQKLIRLHFYPASYQGFGNSLDLFTVKANSFTLLQNFSASITADSLGVAYFVKEFSLSVNKIANLQIAFFASQNGNKTSDFHAFVNGIEIISMPTGLQLIDRLNVGGSSISLAEDSDYLLNYGLEQGYHVMPAIGKRTKWLFMAPPTSWKFRKSLQTEGEHYISGFSRKVFKNFVVMMKEDGSESKCELTISTQSGYDLSVIVKLSNPANSSKRTSSFWPFKFIQKIIAFGHSNSIMTALTILLAIINVAVYKLRRIREYELSQLGDVHSAPNKPSCREFSLAEILSATRNFNDALVIGKGGFGKVYKGFIHGSAELLAIKRLKRDSKQGAREFWREILALSKVHHTNLICLIGYCDESDERILVYQYMPRGTLADNLYKNDRNGKESIPLTWKQRLRICIGVARGLDYLHNGTKYGFIHRDVKDTNILLDENLVAKISDLGLSKLKKIGKTQGEFSTKVRGTVGYIDPEYLMTNKPSTRSDVYAFGMVLLVVLSGRPAVEKSLFEETRTLLFWFRECITKGDISEIIDPSMQGEILTDSLTAFIETVENCLHHHPKQRPAMAQVVAHLERALEKQLGKVPCSGDKSQQTGLSNWEQTSIMNWHFPSYPEKAVYRAPRE